MSEPLLIIFTIFFYVSLPLINILVFYPTFPKSFSEYQIRNLADLFKLKYSTKTPLFESKMVAQLIIFGSGLIAFSINAMLGQFAVIALSLICQIPFGIIIILKRFYPLSIIISALLFEIFLISGLVYLSIT